MHSPFDREDLQAPLAEINMTPLVDVMLVLLVIFLVTAPMLNSAIKLNLPTESAAAIIDEKPIVISVDVEGEFYLDDQQISESQLEQKLADIAKNNNKQQIHLRADSQVEYGKVSHALALMQHYGLTNIGFITREKN